MSYTVGEDGQIMRVSPGGQVSFSDSTRETLRDMRDMADAGYEVLIDGEPLIPTTGFIGWLHRVIDRIAGGRHG
ncbi:hypothetical protein ORG27_14735 [Stenotrophomonas lactitubi]|uniref:hypothetical protein n=1 Tax=Stenotrophomonas lactitubi TaxID=2045214 RepID=UPI002249662A|nr:hypothetical protein [Stenotrophomonas lactitubi]MCX2894833.1 hypothetical protein [Stenotrophomonas lactitubi]